MGIVLKMMKRQWLAKAKTITLIVLGRFWKWYISGFAHRPNRKLYLSGRFWRIVLTPLVLLIVLGLLVPVPVPDEPSSVATAPQPLLSPSPTTSPPASNENDGKASYRMCIDNFNQRMRPTASAAIDKDTKTMEVTIWDSSFTEQEAEQAADVISNSVFKTCTDTFIETVEFQFEGFEGYLTRARPY